MKTDKEHKLHKFTEKAKAKGWKNKEIAERWGIKPRQTRIGNMENKISKSNTDKGGDERAGMRWRCGWCGSPTHKDGTPLSMSEIGLTKDIERNWVNAELVNGDCCAGSGTN